MTVEASDPKVTEAIHNLLKVMFPDTYNEKWVVGSVFDYIINYYCPHPFDSEDQELYENSIELSRNEGELLVDGLQRTYHIDPDLFKFGDFEPEYHVHKKRGSVYKTIAIASLQVKDGTILKDGDELVIYLDLEDRCWGCEITEFNDGRFSKLYPIAQSEFYKSDDPNLTPFDAFTNKPISNYTLKVTIENDNH